MLFTPQAAPRRPKLSVVLRRFSLQDSTFSSVTLFISSLSPPLPFLSSIHLSPSPFPSPNFTSLSISLLSLFLSLSSLESSVFLSLSVCCQSFHSLSVKRSSRLYFFHRRKGNKHLLILDGLLFI